MASVATNTDMRVFKYLKILCILRTEHKYKVHAHTKLVTLLNDLIQCPRLRVKTSTTTPEKDPSSLGQLRRGRIRARRDSMS